MMFEVSYKQMSDRCQNDSHPWAVGLTGRGREGSFQGDGNVLHLDLSAAVYICKNLLTGHL